ncbi:MAG: hypothetical protein V3U82_06905 [Robiginitomaculum sp.]
MSHISMKTLGHSLALTLAFTLGACASTPSPYGPKQSAGGVGFETTRIESDRFRISYTGKNAAEARDLALRRAAEVTTENGYDWFRVIGGNMSGDADARSRVGTSIGIGVGSGGYGYGRRRRGNNVHVNVGVGLGDVIGAVKGPRLTSAIEIRAGKGAKPAGADAYDAQAVLKNIRPAVYAK